MTWLKNIFGNSKSPRPIEQIVPIANVTIPPPDGSEKVYQDQILRKAWAEGMLKGRGVPINNHLPFIESETETNLRTPTEIAQRLLALTIVAMKGQGMEQDQVLQIIKERNARPYFSPSEIRFIDDSAPDENSHIQFSWRYEAAWVMLWALKHVDGPLNPPTVMSDVDMLIECVRDTEDLASNGSRSTNDILNEADLIYRYHWAVSQAGIDGVAAPAGLHGGVVMERHQALNWLIRYEDAEWDEVGTDT